MGRKENQLWQALSATEVPPSSWEENSLIISVNIALPGKFPVRKVFLHGSRNGPIKERASWWLPANLAFSFSKVLWQEMLPPKERFCHFVLVLYKTKRSPFLEFLSFRTSKQADVLKEKVF